MKSAFTVLNMKTVLIFFVGALSLMCKAPDNIKSILFIDEPSDNIVWYGLNDSFDIPNDKLKQKIINALAGEPDESREIALYYGLFLFDYNESYKWFIITAENNHREAHYMLANILLNFPPDLDSKTRGIFWLYGMAKIGYRDTEEWLEREGYTLQTARPPDDSYFPDDYARLSETELEDCETGALQGNKKAAWLLGKYYSEIQVDNEFSEYWYRIGAQNGSPECQYILGQIMSTKEDELEQMRGKFWVDRAIQNVVSTN